MGSEEEEKFGSDSASAIKYTLGFIVTLFVANLSATLLVMLCVVLVDVDILGLMWLWGLSIDSVAIINLVLAVGLAGLLDEEPHPLASFVGPGLRVAQVVPDEWRDRVLLGHGDVDLRDQHLDEGFGAAALEQVLETIESWNAQSLVTGVSAASEAAIASLEASHLVLRKDLPEAIATAFQVADAQKHLL